MATFSIDLRLGLTAELDQPQHAVGRGMLGPHVDDLQLVVDHHGRFDVVVVDEDPLLGGEGWLLVARQQSVIQDEEATQLDLQKGQTIEFNGFAQ